MKFLKEHLFAIFAIFVLLIIVAASGVAVYLLFYSEDGDPYHTRLVNIEKYPIDSKKINDIKEKLIESGKVDKVSYNLEGRLINFEIYFVKDTALNDAKGIGAKVLEDFTKEQLAYYDLHITLINEEEYAEVEAKNKELEAAATEGKEQTRIFAVYPVFGTKHKTSETIRFTK